MSEVNVRMADSLKALKKGLEDPFNQVMIPLLPASPDHLQGNVGAHIPALGLMVASMGYKLYTALPKVVEHFAKLKAYDVVAFIGARAPATAGLTEHTSRMVFVDHDKPNPASIVYTYVHELAHVLDPDCYEVSVAHQARSRTENQQLAALECVAYGVALCVGEEIGIQQGFMNALTGLVMYGVTPQQLDEQTEKILSISNEILAWLNRPSMNCLTKFTRSLKLFA